MTFIQKITHFPQESTLRFCLGAYTSKYKSNSHGFSPAISLTVRWWGKGRDSLVYRKVSMSLLLSSEISSCCLRKFWTSEIRSSLPTYKAYFLLSSIDFRFMVYCPAVVLFLLLLTSDIMVDMALAPLNQLLLNRNFNYPGLNNSNV